MKFYEQSNQIKIEINYLAEGTIFFVILFLEVKLISVVS